MSAGENLQRYDHIEPRHVLRSLIRAPMLYGLTGMSTEILDNAPTINNVNILWEAYRLFVRTQDAEPFAQAWRRLDAGRRNRRWKARFRARYPLVAHTLDRLDPEHERSTYFANNL